MLPRSKGHHRDWLLAAKGGPAASAGFEYGARLTGARALGCVVAAHREEDLLGRHQFKARGLPEADAIIKEQYRKGWEIA